MKFLSGMSVMAMLCVVAASAADAKVFTFPYQRVDLSNGFRAYLVEVRGSGQIAYVTVVRTGSREEWEPGRSGYAHFFEHMMFRGTRKYPDFSGVLTRLGADHNAFTSNDMTVYYEVASADSLEQLMDLESDRFKNLDYSEADFRTEAGAVLGEYNQGRANPFSFLNEALRDTAFDRHTYKHTTIGFEADVRGMPEGYEYSRSFFRRYYRPENCVLILAGDFDPSSAAELLRKYYSDWESGYSAPEIEPEPPQQAPRQAQVDFPGRTLPLLAVAYKGPAWNATDRVAVAATVLGEAAFGSNSELYRRLVLREQVVQMMSADFSLRRDPYLLTVTAMVTDTANLGRVETAILETVAGFQEQLLDPARLAKVKRALRYEFLMGLETAQSVAFALLEPVVYTGTLEAVEDYYRTLDSLSPEDVQTAARTFLVDRSRTVLTLLPKAE
jgi:zinc protease